MAGNALKRKLCDSGGNATKKPFGHWSMGLKSSMDDPELRVDSDDKCVIIKDKYPKVVTISDTAMNGGILIPMQPRPTITQVTETCLN